jgi:hypothetical protein
VVLPREYGSGFSGRGFGCGEAAWRSMSDASARGGGFSALRSSFRLDEDELCLLARLRLGLFSRANRIEIHRKPVRRRESNNDEYQVDDERQQDALAPGHDAANGRNVRVALVDLEVHQ